jgi:tight adherence protein B
LAAGLLALATGTGAGIQAGPVAGGLAAVYAVLGFLAWLRTRRARARAAAWSEALDALSALAADLRAGLAPSSALAAHWRIEAVPLVKARVSVAWRVAEATGAPVADLLDRLDVDLRGLQRVRLSASAHAAGTRATAALLALLPLAGIGVGYGMGTDPLRVLLHTPVGTGCAIGAVLLQLAGLAWTDRLSRPPDGLR